MIQEIHATVDAATAALRNPLAFATTHWSLVVEAVEEGTKRGQDALEELCRTYWPPLYAFARRQGMSPADAEDLTQSFFEDLLTRGTLSVADPERGRFRSFLLTSFRHFHSHQLASASSEKRGGKFQIVSLEAMREMEEQLQHEPATTETPEKLHDRKWATSTLAKTLAAVQREYMAVGKAALFETLKDVLWSGRGEVPYINIARHFDTTESAIKMAAFRLRKRVGEQFRLEVGKTILTPGDVDEEIRYLLAAMSD